MILWSFENGVISKGFASKEPLSSGLPLQMLIKLLLFPALKQPDLDFHQLNRYIALAKYYKIPVALCFWNKEDLGLENDAQD